MKTILEAKRVKKIYGTRGNVFTALEDIDLSVQEGEFVGIMGPSGAGKSTLLNILATIDEPTSGDITIDSSNITDMSEDTLAAFRHDKLGFIFQDYNLLDTLTVKENIILPLALAKTSVTDIAQRLNAVARRFGIEPILDKYPYQISGGQKQRTAASRAIITNPTLVLADEPTGALDSKSATDLLETLKDLSSNDNATILMVTHDAYAASYSQRILFIKDGKLFTELIKGNKSRKKFFNKILDILAALGGEANDII
ncbi:ABC transporter ATP-binding protein [Thalassobacillus pellis]|uniref:ABC transporter ATP-binding protein n=1 Tax=Thalassobacillus pellis TaxID=748008 RepID=UPI0019618528|nr:ABC transporter ATP-binding protein [Thalassobacillus pellis]MBM7553436.1 putative ABC transport system ATP-binding protein [Thalassobacillus pellis]